MPPHGSHVKLDVFIVAHHFRAIDAGGDMFLQCRENGLQAIPGIFKIYAYRLKRMNRFKRFKRFKRFL